MPVERPSCIYSPRIKKYIRPSESGSTSQEPISDCRRRTNDLNCLHPTGIQEFRYCPILEKPFKNPSFPSKSKKHLINFLSPNLHRLQRQ